MHSVIFKKISESISAALSLRIWFMEIKIWTDLDIASG